MVICGIHVLLSIEHKRAVSSFLSQPCLRNHLDYSEIFHIWLNTVQSFVLYQQFNIGSAQTELTPLTLQKQIWEERDKCVSLKHRHQVLSD